MKPKTNLTKVRRQIPVNKRPKLVQVFVLIGGTTEGLAIDSATIFISIEYTLFETVEFLLNIYSDYLRTEAVDNGYQRMFLWRAIRIFMPDMIMSK